MPQVASSKAYVLFDPRYDAAVLSVFKHLDLSLPIGIFFFKQAEVILSDLLTAHCAKFARPATLKPSLKANEFHVAVIMELLDYNLQVKYVPMRMPEKLNIAVGGGIVMHPFFIELDDCEYALFSH